MKMARRITKREIKNIISLIFVGIFSGLIVIEMRDFVARIGIGSPILIGLVGMLLAAYIFEID